MTSAALPTKPQSLRAANSGLKRNFRLVIALATRDLKARHKGTMLGWVWSLLVPIAQVAVYSLVFSLILRMIPPDMGNGDPGIYWVWFITGLVPWTLFASSVTRSPGNLLGSRPLMQKVYFPSYVPVLATVCTVLFQTLLELGIVFAIMGIFGNLSAYWLLLPLALAIYLVFIYSLSFLLSVANVYVRDLQMIVPVAVQLMFFLSGVIIPLSRVPESWNGIPLQQILSYNPMAQFVQVFRDLIYFHTMPGLETFLYVSMWAIVLLGLAVISFRRFGQDVGEML